MASADIEREEEINLDDPPAYYKDIGVDAIPRAFKNLDDRFNLDGFDRKLKSAATRNFIVDFGDGEDAWCAFDLDAESMNGLMRSNVRALGYFLIHHLCYAGHLYFRACLSR